METLWSPVGRNGMNYNRAGARNNNNLDFNTRRLGHVAPPLGQLIPAAPALFHTSPV